MECTIDGITFTLEDDGTLDTVIVVTGRHDNTQEERLSQEFAASYRDEDGYFSDESFAEMCEELL